MSANLSRLLVLLVAFGLLTACEKKGEIKNQIVGQPIATGSADDGNDTNDPANGKTYPPNRQAKDNLTEAASDQPAAKMVGGSVKAIPAPPQGATKDVARATSFNGVKSVFVVNKADAFTFKIDLKLTKPVVTKNASLSVQVRANVLDSNGATIANAQITDITYDVTADANGKTQVSPAGTSPEQLDAAGNYERSLTGPNQGIQLQPGNYQIELEIRLIATASTAPGGDSAQIEKATASIQVR